MYDFSEIQYIIGNIELQNERELFRIKNITKKRKICI